jgi:hypothetical protein
LEHTLNHPKPTFDHKNRQNARDSLDWPWNFFSAINSAREEFHLPQEYVGRIVTRMHNNVWPIKCLAHQVSVTSSHASAREPVHFYIPVLLFLVALQKEERD